MDIGRGRVQDVGVSRIFVSYRSDDSAYPAAGLAGELGRWFGADRVFLDSRSLRAGAVYPPAIRAALHRCTALVAVIGPNWLAGRRIDDPKDWVRIELRAAFKRGITVVPTLLDGATMPRADQLPRDVATLALSQFRYVRGRSFEADVEVLAHELGARRQQSGATWTQHNEPRDGGVVYASQGGTQHIINRGGHD
jgi:hypothetical protein